MKTFQEKLISSAVDYNGHQILRKLIYDKGYNLDQIKVITGYKSNHIYNILTDQQSCSIVLRNKLLAILESKEYIYVEIPKKICKTNIVDKIKDAARKLFSITKHVTPEMIWKAAGISRPSFYRYTNFKKIRKEFYEKVLVH